MSIAFLLLLLGAITGLCWVRWLFGPGGDGTIAELSSPVGRDFKVVQKYNGTIVEPYTLGFYHRTGEGEWKWKYLDHESTRWANAKLIWDAAKSSVGVFRDGDLVEEFSLAELDEVAAPAAP